MPSSMIHGKNHEPVVAVKAMEQLRAKSAKRLHIMIRLSLDEIFGKGAPQNLKPTTNPLLSLRQGFATKENARERFLTPLRPKETQILPGPSKRRFPIVLLTAASGSKRGRPS